MDMGEDEGEDGWGMCPKKGEKRRWMRTGVDGGMGNGEVAKAGGFGRDGTLLGMVVLEVDA